MSLPPSNRSDPATTHYTEAQPGWLHLHAAQFRFLPGFTKTEAEFASGMPSLIRSLTGAPIAVDVDAFAVSVEIEGVSLRIDTELAQLSLEALDDPLASVTNGMDDPIGLPNNFFAALDTVDFVPRYRTGGEVLAQIARRLWSSLQRRFQLAVTDGAAQLYGRWRSIDAPFARVFPDQLNELYVETTETDPMFGEDVVTRSVLRSRETSEIVVYAPRVQFVKQMQRSKGTDAEKRATADLIDEIRAAPDQPRTRAEVKADYIERFKISSYSFDDRVWPDALEQVPNNKWRNAGRRPGSKNTRATSKVQPLHLISPK